jgi:hypothetical protein
MKNLRGNGFVLVFILLVSFAVTGCKVSGRITDGGTGIADLTVKLSGDKVASTTTDSQGNYKFSVGYGSYTVTPVPDGGGVFLPTAKQVYVRGFKGAGADFSRLSDDGVYWDPSLVVPIQAHPDVRGFKIIRGLIHLHSIYSHDACDNKPFIDGEPNTECLCQLREAICSTNQQYIMMSDHSDNFAWHEFPDVLLYQPENGDELIYKDGRPVANIIKCDSGNNAIITAGSENNLMPIGLKRMPDGTPEERRALLTSTSVDTVDKLHALGAMVFVTHPESWKTDDLLNLPIDGIDVYNLHANIDPGIREEYLGLPSLGFIPGILDMLTPSWDDAHSDLLLLSFFEEIKPDLMHWDKMLYYRPTTGFLATDAHRNSLPFLLPDGDRGDSYRRMMRWFANYVLVRDQNLDEIENAVFKGRMYGAFQVFGEPIGFDFYAEAGSQTFEMGDNVSLDASPVLHIKVPEFFRMDPGLEKPELRISLIKAGQDGGVTVAESLNTDLEYAAMEKGAYRAEIKIVPYHLRKWLGDHTKPFIKEYPFIYANPIFIN